MKKYWLFKFFLYVSINLITLSLNNLNAQEKFNIMSNDDYVELLSKDSMFVSNCQLDLIIKEQIVNGNFRLFKDSIMSKLLEDKTMTYCKLLEEYPSGSKNLKLHLNAHCENSKIREVLKNKYREYWSLPVQRKVAIKEKIKADLNLRPTRLELELIFIDRITSGK